MGRLNNDEQFKFLISCIRYSNNGKVDFTEVAQECNIVSKGAAAKRYERMMKAHGIHQPVNTSRESATPVARPSKDGLSTQPSKKRKLDLVDSYVETSQERHSDKPIKEEGNCADTRNTTIKSEAATGTDNDILGYNWGGVQENGATAQHNAADDGVFNDFFHSAAFEPVNIPRYHATHGRIGSLEPPNAGFKTEGQTQEDSAGSGGYFGKDVSLEGVVIVD